MRRPARGVPLCLGGYQVLAHLARGGMGGIYMARHPVSGDRVALKALDPQWAHHDDATSRLHFELEVSGRIDHSGVIRIFEAGLDQGVPFLVMELIDGEDLGSLVERGRLELAAATAIAAQTADALAATHAAGIIHCDLKPANVMALYDRGLAGWPRVKVLDFGVARRVDGPADEVAGTPPYMAPEQWHGRASFETDVYGLGCVLYELCTGAPPFAGAITEVMAQHADHSPMPLSRLRDVPDALERLVHRMLAKDPTHRPSMPEVSRHLGELAVILSREPPPLPAAQVATGARPPTPVPAPSLPMVRARADHEPALACAG